MPIEQRTLVLQGYTDLQKAWAVADKETSKELRVALRDAAEPVRSDAQALTLHRIDNMTIPYSRWKVGVTRKSVYVAPKWRETRIKSRKRPKLADLMAERAAQPALTNNIRRVEAEVDAALGRVGRKWEQV